MLLDGRVVTACGLNMSALHSFKSGYVYETFGITRTSARYHRLGKRRGQDRPRGYEGRQPRAVSGQNLPPGLCGSVPRRHLVRCPGHVASEAWGSQQVSESLLTLTPGLELWKFNIDEAREQDVNARAMTKAAFERLSATVSRDKRLESLPLLAVTDVGLEIVSGHHRVRCLRASGITDWYALVDTSGLTRDQIRAKQLAHNSIQGQDNAQLLSEIYNAIEDVTARLDAFIDPRAVERQIPSIKVEDVQLSLKTESVLVMFLPIEREEVEKAMEAVKREVDSGAVESIWVEDREAWSAFSAAVKRVVGEYDIRNMGTVMAKLAELAMRAMGEELQEHERVSLRDLLGSAYMPKGSADVIRRALNLAEKTGISTKKTAWKAVEAWARVAMGEPELYEAEQPEHSAS